MSLRFDPRQKAMLEHMGLRLDWLTSATTTDPEPPQEATEPAPPPPATVSPAAAARMAPPPRPTAPRPDPSSVASPQAPRPDPSGLDWEPLRQAVSQCTACNLCKTRQQTVFGVGSPPPSHTGGAIDLMIVGEAPGEHEDVRGEPFVGAAGQLLDQMLDAVGLSRHPDGGSQGKIHIANVLKCRPPGNRNPQPEEMAQCLPYLERQIELLQPKVVLAMGRFGAQALLASTVPDVATTPLGKLRGPTYRYRDKPVVVTYHPAYLLRSPIEKAKAWADLCLALDLIAAT